MLFDYKLNLRKNLKKKAANAAFFLKFSKYYLA